jgi:phenylacetate-CoA ligase
MGWRAELGGKSNRGIYPLPFVYLFGRADFTVSYFGANIYPENVSVGLEQPGLRDWVSGKFVLQVTETIDRDKALSVVIELAAGVAGNEQMAWTIANAIHQELLRLNSEFANYVPAQHQMPLY